jgi:hypothetical protein
MNYPNVQTKSISVDELNIYYPIEGVQGTDQCWLSAFPCTPIIHPRLERRGSSIKNGFRIKSQ